MSGRVLASSLQTLPERGRRLGARRGHGRCHLCTPFSVAASALKWVLQLCLPGGVGLTLPFTKPTVKHNLFLQVVDRSLSSSVPAHQLSHAATRELNIWQAGNIIFKKRKRKRRKGRYSYLILLGTGPVLDFHSLIESSQLPSRAGAVLTRFTNKESRGRREGEGNYIFRHLINRRGQTRALSPTTHIC